MPGQTQQMGQIVVRGLFPAGRPDQLEALREPLAGGVPHAEDM